MAPAGDVSLGLGDVSGASHAELLVPGVAAGYGGVLANLSLRGNELSRADRKRMERHISLAIMGVPNVGKSTMTNHLLGMQRVVAGPEPGLTRDPVEASFQHAGKTIDLVDTPGWIKKSTVDRYDEVGGAVAAASQGAGVRALNFAQVVLLMVDAQSIVQEGQALTRREVGLAALAVEEGRALVIALNKMDTCTDREQQLRVLTAVHREVEKHLPQIGDVACVPLSAATGRGTNRLLQSILNAWDSWNMRIPTAALNKWLAQVAAKYHGTATGKSLRRVRFVTQVSTRPPAFAVFVSGSDPPDQAFEKFMVHALRSKFQFVGTPLRVMFRTKKKQKRY